MKNIEWLKKEIQKLPVKYYGFSILKHKDEYMVDKDEVIRLINQLDEPEVNGQIDKLANFIMSEVEGEPSRNQGAVDTAIRIIKSYQNQETLSQEWIDEHTYHEDEYDFYYADPDELKNLLVPKQEEVDQAYKDGYEKGKQHTFYKGYLEGLADKENEPETVADVISDFWKSFERLKEVLGTEVEELEE